MNGSLGALLQEALADEERRLELLEARLAALRGQQQQQQPAPAPSASDSTQAIWAALAMGPGRAPTAPAPSAPAPAPAPAPDDAGRGEAEQGEEEAAADAEDWAALASPEREAGEPSVTAYAAAAAAVEDAGAPPAAELDPRLEAARRLLLQSGQGLQELKSVLARVPGWEDASPAAAEAADARREERDEEFWSPPSTPVAADDDDDDEAPAPEVPARDRPTRTRPSDAAAFGLERAFRGEAPPQGGGEPGWARELRERQERGAEVLGRVEELLLELGKTIATVLEAKSGHARGDAALEARAERAERECEALRRAVAERAARIARLEALVEQVMVGPVAAPTAPALTPRGTRRPASQPPGPSEALRRTLLGSPAQSTEASRRALKALEPIADEGDRARLRQSLAELGAQHAQLLDRLVRLLES